MNLSQKLTEISASTSEYPGLTTTTPWRSTSPNHNQRSQRPFPSLISTSRMTTLFPNRSLRALFFSTSGTSTPTPSRPPTAPSEPSPSTLSPERPSSNSWKLLGLSRSPPPFSASSLRTIRSTPSWRISASEWWAASPARRPASTSRAATTPSPASTRKAVSRVGEKTLRQADRNESLGKVLPATPHVSQVQRVLAQSRWEARSRLPSHQWKDSGRTWSENVGGEQESWPDGPEQDQVWQDWPHWSPLLRPGGLRDIRARGRDDCSLKA